WPPRRATEPARRAAGAGGQVAATRRSVPSAAATAGLARLVPFPGARGPGRSAPDKRQALAGTAPPLSLRRPRAPGGLRPACRPDDRKAGQIAYGEYRRAHAGRQRVDRFRYLVTEKVEQLGSWTVPCIELRLGGGPLRPTITYPSGWLIQWSGTRTRPFDCE